jgi:O-antigen/teichoic acid export membrane protein
MDTKRKFFTHFSLYFTSEVIVQMSGLISLPIFARIFSTDEYGQYNLILSVFVISETIASLGLRSSLMRFYMEYKMENRGKEFNLFSTLFMMIIMSSIILIIILSIGSMFISKHIGFAPTIVDIISFSASLILIRNIIGLMQNHFRILDKPYLYAIVNIVTKYIPLGLILLLIIKYQWGIPGLYFGYLVGEGSICLVLLLIYRIKYGKKLYFFSKEIIKESFKYGLPILGNNLSGNINSQCNRFIIAPMLGVSAVGLYSMGYNLCSYIQTFVIIPLHMTISPICYNLWGEKGKEETAKFVSSYFRFFCLISLPIIFGLTAIGKDFIKILATDKFQDSATIIPLIITGLLISGGHFPFFAGLYLLKNPIRILKIALFVAIFNICLNLALIPLLGLIGAAITPLVSSILFVTLGYHYSSKILKINFNTGHIIKYLLFSLTMYFIVILSRSVLEPTIISLIINVFIGLGSYLILVVVFDKSIQNLTISTFKKAKTFLKDIIPISFT